MKKFIAFVGHLRGGQFSTGPLRLFCSLKCANEAGFSRAQQVAEPGDGSFLDDSPQCFKCGADLWREVPNEPRNT